MDGFSEIFRKSVGNLLPPIRPPGFGPSASFAACGVHLRRAKSARPSRIDARYRGIWQGQKWSSQSCNKGIGRGTHARMHACVGGGTCMHACVGGGTHACMHAWVGAGIARRKPGMGQFQSVHQQMRSCRQLIWCRVAWACMAGRIPLTS